MQKNITEEVLFNHKDINVRLNNLKYVNNLMNVWDGANKPNMQDVLYHFQLPGLAICKLHARLFPSG